MENTPSRWLVEVERGDPLMTEADGTPIGGGRVDAERIAVEEAARLEATRIATELQRLAEEAAEAERLRQQQEQVQPTAELGP
jgi:hypothetical protein